MTQITMWALIPQNYKNIQWVFMGPDHGVRAQGQGSFDELAKVIQKHPPKQTYFLLGFEDFYIRRVVVPKKTSAAKLKTLLPYLLEDEILQDIEEVTFYPLQQTKEYVDVLIYDKEKFNHFFDIITSHQLSPDWILPLSFMLPSAWHMLVIDNMAHVNLPGYCFSAPMPQALKLLPVAYDKASEKPPFVTILGDDKDIEQSLPYEIKKKDMPSFFKYLSQNHHKPSFNLTKFGNGKTAPVISRKTLLVHTSMIATLFLIFSFGFPIYKLYQFRHMQASLQQDIESIYFKLYPQAKAVVAPKIRMQRELAKNTESQQQTFLYLLSKVGTSLNQYPDILVQALQYRDQILQMDLETKDYASIDHIMADLNKQPLKVTQKNTTKSANVVRTSLHIERGSE